jgi:hypothetical protein
MQQRWKNPCIQTDKQSKRRKRRGKMYSGIRVPKEGIDTNADGVKCYTW